MSLRASHLTAQITSLRKKIPEACTVAVHSRTKWEGPAELEIDDLHFLVQNCPSELSMRQALVDAGYKGQPVVCITALQEQDIGADLRARLTKQRVFAVDAWTSVKDIFCATHLDPRLKKKTWLAEALLEYYPNSEYEAVPNGVLTAKTVWYHVLKNLLHLEGEGPDLRDLLLWTLDRSNADLYCRLDDTQRNDVKDRIAETAGTAALHVLSCVESGHAEKALPLCLACEVIYGLSGSLPRKLQEAAVRLEKYTDGMRVDREHGLRLANAAALVCDSLGGNGGKQTVDHIIVKLDRLLAETGAVAYAEQSRFSSKGFEELLNGFASHIHEVLSERIKPEKCWPYIVRVRDHYQGRGSPDRVAQAEMAYRVLRWLSSTDRVEGKIQDMVDLVRTYSYSDSYVDWALSVLAGAEGNEKLADAYTSLSKRAEDLRSAFDNVFASQLQQCEKEGKEKYHSLGVEGVLDRIVTPLAKEGPVLLVVMDAMSCAVFDELMADILQRGHWYELSPSPPRRTTALAVMPSITEVSRRSLLCGHLAREKEPEEAGFSSHPGLAATSSMSPALYVKSELLEKGGTQLATALRKSIKSSKQCVVGVVINAVDDYLLKGDQLRVNWKLSSIAVLESIMKEAQSAGRTVILASDHGHVMERGSEYIVDESGGERYRKNTGCAREGEIQIEGKRVLAFDGSIIAPWRADLRYGSKRNGYHGGVSPREMIVPLGVLSPKPEGPDGWGLVASAVPPWWYLEREPVSLQEISVGREGEKEYEAVSDLPLFDTVQSSGAPEWINEMLRSSVFSHSKGLCGRSVLGNKRLTTLLMVLEKHGDSVVQERLAADLQVPAFRLPGIVRIAQRMLNIDGYAVLSFDQGSGVITLDKNLLKKQFELNE